MAEEKNLDSLLEEMSDLDLIISLVYLKPVKSQFSNFFVDEAFAMGLGSASQEYSQLKSLFHSGHTDDTGESNSVVGSILSNIHFFPYDGSYQYQSLSSISRDKVEKEFKQKYGESYLEILKPLAENIWDIAKSWKRY